MINQEIRENVISNRADGFSYGQIAKKYNLQKSTVQSICIKKALTGLKKRRGAPRKIDDRGSRRLLRQIMSGELDTAQELAKKNTEFKASSETMRRMLKRSGMVAATKVKKPMLTRRHKANRLNFAQVHRHWTISDWRKVIFSDESKINRVGCDGRLWCWKEKSSSLSDRVVAPTLKFGGGSLMVWGCISVFGPGYLCRIDGGLDADLYCNILQDELLRTITENNQSIEEIIFQHDNDPKHTSKKAVQWLENHHINVLQWPSQSPDLNPIEHAWSILKKKLASYENSPNGICELWERVEKEWYAVSAEQCVKLIESMPERVLAVIKAKGGYMRY